MTKKQLESYRSMKAEIGEMNWNYENRVKQLIKECEEVESFVESIPDSETRRIFRMRYIEGKKNVEIAKALNFDRSNIGKRINKYLAQNPCFPQFP